MTTATFRNGNQLIRAQQLASGDWLVAEERSPPYLETDAEFRDHWEPANQAAVRMWRRDSETVPAAPAGDH